MVRKVIKADYNNVTLKAINLYVTNKTIISVKHGEKIKQKFLNGCRAEDLYDEEFQQEAYDMLFEN